MEAQKTRKSLPAWAILGIISLVAALVLALTNSVTEGPIKAREAEELKATFSAVMPADQYAEISIPASGYDGVTNLVRAEDSSGSLLGYAVKARAQGYGGPVAVTLGVNPSGSVEQVVIGDGDFAETNGFGARWQTEENQNRLVGLTTEGGAFEALSGATRTSGAVLSASNAAMKAVRELALGQAAAEGSLISFGAPAGADGAAAVAIPEDAPSASAKGFAGDVTVRALFDEDGVTLLGIAVDTPNETEGIGQRCSTDEFTAQFAGKTLPVTLGEDVDALAGATVTSTAAVKALNSLASTSEPITELSAGKEGQLGVTDSGAFKLIPSDSYSGDTTVRVTVKNGVVTGAEIVPADAAQPAAPAAAGETRTTTAKGYDGQDVIVTLTLDGSTITAIDIDASSQTPGLGQRAMEDAFKDQFVGKTIPVDAAQIDALASATVTTNAVIEAVNSIEAGAQAPEAGPAEAAAGGETKTVTVKGYEDGDVIVTVTLDGSTITAIEIDASSQTYGLGQKAMDPEFKNQFVGKTIPVDAAQIDAIASATVTTNAVIEAVNSIEAGTDAAAEPAAEPAAGETRTATAKGYDGQDVIVTLTLDGSTITAIDIDASSQTPGLGQRAMEDAFKDQFVGKTIPVDAAQIDALASATVTTNAVIEAVNSIEAGAQAAESAESGAPAEDTGARTVTAKGYEDGEITLTVSLDGNTITALGIDAASQTWGVGQRVEWPEFTGQLVGKTLPVSAEGIDGFTGSTVTVSAVVEALNSLTDPSLPTSADLAEPAAAEPSEVTRTASAAGYDNGIVTVKATLDGNTITALGVDASSQTWGVGQRVEWPEFTGQLVGKTLPVSAADLDGFPGSTVTVNAVIEALNSLVDRSAVEETRTASAKGYEDGDVSVSVTLKGNTITALEVDANSQTWGVGQRMMWPEFTRQLVGKTLPVSAADIDGFTSSTVTINAVIEALNSLTDESLPTSADLPAQPAAEAAPEPEAEGEPVEASPAAEPLTATAKGYDGLDVIVTLTLDGSTITAIDIDASSQTQGLGQRAMEDTFKDQFIGKTIPVDAAQIDAIAHATVTTNAVIEAVNSLAADDQAPEAGPVEAAAGGETKTVTVKGYEDGDVIVTVTLDGSTITAIDIDASSQTNGLGQKAMEPEFKNQFVGKTIPVDASQIDAIAHATVTTEAVIGAVNSLADSAGEAPAAADSEAKTVTAKGYEDGEIIITVTLDGQTITAIEIDASSQTWGVGQRVEWPEFTQQLVGQTLPVSAEDIDGFTSSTITVDAVLDAVNGLAE